MNNMTFTNMNLCDFIEHIITFDNIDDLLKTCKTQSEKGFIFERLADIIIKFGYCHVFSNSNFIYIPYISDIFLFKKIE